MVSPVTMFNCRGRLLVMEDPVVMGILNITPDSFYGSSRIDGESKAVDKAGSMIEQGAVILDIGGMSSRLGAELISVTEEIDRIVPIIEVLRKNFPDVFLSVDTFRADVVRKAAYAGIDIINDISGGRFDQELFNAVAEVKLPYILMHNGISFDTMHVKPGLGDPVTTVFDYFTSKIQELNNLGVYDIFLDPGFGFGKKMNENFSLLKNLSFFNILNLPVLAGISRKSMVHKNLQVVPEEALNGTTAVNMYALSQGAKVLRVHDVREAVQAVDLFRLIRDSDKEIYQN